MLRHNLANVLMLIAFFHARRKGSAVFRAIKAGDFYDLGIGKRRLGRTLM